MGREVPDMEELKQPAENTGLDEGGNEEINISEAAEGKPAVSLEEVQAELDEQRDKYLRLYADFENYRKKMQKDKEELIKYSNESLVYELLPVIDSMEMALKHSAEGNAEAVQSLKQGVENTLRELNRTLEKFGVKAIEAVDMPFDPAYHHAMSQVEREDKENNTVVEEFRRGYLFNEKVLRPSMVAVSKKPGG